MKNLKTLIVPILISITLMVSVYSCVMVLEMSDNIETLQEEDEKIMEQLQKDMIPPEVVPVLSDTLSYYYTDKRLIEVDYNTNYWVTIHRFFFVRAKYTDSLYNGFSIVVADINNKGIIIERQENVTLSQSNLGEIVDNWQFKLDTLTIDKKQYSDYSDKGLKVKTYIRTNKY